MVEIKILFVCKFNRFRSKVAEAYFNKINRNPNFQARSAGIIEGNPINKLQKRIAKKMEININNPPRGVSAKLLTWQNLTIIVANNVPKRIFNKNKKEGKKTILWKIKDEEKGNEKKIEKLIRRIIKKVDKLYKKLGILESKDNILIERKLK